MANAICYFAGSEDNRVLCEFLTSLGLSMFPILMDQPEIMPGDDPAAGPFCYLSPLPRSQLHPYGRPLGIGHGTDPLLGLFRSYLSPPDGLVMGQLHCPDDVAFLHTIIRPYFTRIASWIRREWVKLPDGHQYIGPEALSLAENGTKLLQLPPSVKVRQVQAGGRGQDDSENGD